jgi:hypothetical protein
MPTKTSVGPNEVVRIEVLRLVPPLGLTGHRSQVSGVVGTGVWTADKQPVALLAKK